MLTFLCFFVQLESLPAMVSGVWSDDPHQQLEATTQFRKLLSIGITCSLWLEMLFSPRS
jgi:hypothetical protein